MSKVEKMTATAIDTVIGRNVAELRRFAKMTQPELGAAMSTPVTEQAVSKWEKGTSRIGAAQLVEIAQALGCTLIDLFEGVEGVLRHGEVRPARTRRVDSLIKDYTAINDPAVQDVIANMTRALALELSTNFKRIDRHDKH